MFTRETPNVKREIEQKFSKSKNLPNFDLLGGLEVRGFKIFRFLLQKAHPCVNPRHLSHLREDRLRGLTPRRVPEKSQKVSNSHRKDMSPLTQGLNYRSACDNSIVVLVVSAEEGGFYVFTSVCLSDRRIIEKVVNGF